MISVCLSFSCLIFLGIIASFYFGKVRLKNIDNKIFSFLIILNLVGIFIDVGGFISFKYLGTASFINVCISKVYLVYYLTYIFCLFLYVYNMSFNNFVKKYKLFLELFVPVCLLVLVLPIDVHMEDAVAYSYGLSVNFAYLVAFGFVFFMIYCIVKNRKNIKNKAYLPLFAFILLTLVTIVVQKINPEITLLLLSNSIVTVLMYFTIENPDVQMIGELYKNKKIIESSNEGTSRFLFKLTQDIKNPVNELNNISKNISSLNNIDEIKESVSVIQNYSAQLDYLINKALNISAMDTGKIKVFRGRYNIYNIFKEAVYNAQSGVKDGVTFQSDITTNIPQYLYGDSIRLKQVINSIINNSIKNTESGFISLEVNSIIKYDICRLFINIEDSSNGMDVETINKLLSLNDEELDSIEVSEDSTNLDFKSIKKLVHLMGGSILIKSDDEKGTTVVITLDQKIVDTENAELSKKLDNYEQILYGGKKYLVIDEDESELKDIVKKIEKDGIRVDSSIFERDCIDKIRRKLKYDLIILDDEMPNINAIDILKELKKNPNFKTPVVIMINDNKDGIKLQYMKDGFADCIMKSKLNTEIERIKKLF